MLELVDRWFLSNHDVMSSGFNSQYSYITYILRVYNLYISHKSRAARIEHAYTKLKFAILPLNYAPTLLT